MQKTANRILSALLVLVMVLSVLPASVFATGEAEGPFVGWSLTLGDNIGVNFYLEEEAANYSVGVTVAGNAAATTAETKDGYYVVTANVAAAQMTDTIALSVANGEETLHTGEYSVRQYALTILEGQYDVEVKQMVQEMLNYGAAAQTYFDYNTDNLANDGYELESAAEIPSEVPAIDVQDNLSGIALYGMSLLFQNKVAVRFYFHGSGDMNSYTFKVGDTAYTPVAKGDQYYVQVEGITPQDLDKAIDLVVSKGDATLTVSYSPMTYIVRMYNSSESAQALKDLVQSMNGYHLEAVEYQKYLAIVPISTMSLAAQYGTNGLDLNADGSVKNIYASADVNDAPGGSWSYEYTPVEAAGLQLIRAGETYNVGIPGSGTIVKFGDAGYCIKLEAWTVANSMLPLQENDVLVIDGRYNLTSDSSVVVDFDKTYLYYDGAAVAFSAEMPTLPTTVEVSALSKHDTNGWASNGVYFKLEENAAPFDGWSVEYTPVVSENLKLIRGGETYNIGFPGRGTIVKYNATDYFLKMEWNVGEYAPMQDGDILIVEGGFVNEASKVTLNLPKTYIYANGANVEISTEMPTLPTTVEGSALSKHDANGWASNGVYFKLEENAAPFDGWSVEYTPVASENLKLIRGGETYNIGFPGRGTIVKYSATEYFLKMEWNVGEYAPMQDGDILIVEGGFVNEASKVTLNLPKTYIYANGANVEISTEMPTLPTTVEGSALSKHDTNGWASNGVYFKLEENAAPFDGWTVEYTPVASENLKLIRGGETYNIGFPGRGTIVKYSATEYFLKMEWNVGEYAPMQDGDILIVEGGFVNDASKVTLNLPKTYIYANGENVEFSTEMPTLPSTVEGGVMQSHNNGMSGNGIYFKLDTNDAPYDGWNIEYAQTGTSGIKLIRDGVTKDIGIVDRPLIVKYSDTEYYLKLEGWTIGDYGLNSSDPITTSDVLIIEGGFVNNANKVTLNISKSYIYYDGAAWICAATLPVEVEGGNMTAHDEGWDPSDGIYASMAENSIPVDENAEVTYAGTVKLVRAGANYDVAAALIKFGATDYYLSLAGSNYLPLADNDYLVVEGAFVNNDNGYTLNVAKTYILVDGDNLVFSDSEPVLETEYALTGLTNHTNGWTADGIYISHDAHEATVGTDWSVRYRPVSADVIKLVRGGETFNIGQPAGDTLVVYGNTNMYFETKAWTTQGGKLPFVDGDMIIIEGKFKHEASGDILVVEKTVICVNGTDLIFNPIITEALTNHANGVSGEGIYATMTENAAPYDGWSIEYTPVTADAYYVIRNGEQINIGIPGRGTMVKYSATEYFLKINAWCTDNFAYTTDDIIVIDGYWKQNTGGNAVMKMEKTYLYYDGSAWTFATELPSIINAGLMQTHENGMSGTGIYFSMDANEAPYKEDWSLEYTQTSVDNIKLIRDGETVSIGIVGRPLFAKFGETNYFLKLEKWTIGEYGVNGGTTPITTDDVIIIEGNFRYDNVTLNITKSYVYYDGSAWICSAEAPAQKNVVDVVELGSHGNGWTSGGFYFTAAANNAPYDGWSLRYKPVSADVIKVIKADGTTTNVGNTGGETIVKYSDTEYYVEGWAVGSANMAAGNTFVIEGQFYNEANDVYIDVEKTSITLNADGSTTIIADSDKYIQAGTMSAYTSNWFGDGIYFVLGSNIAPAAEDWTVRYMPKNAANIKLVRGGEVYNIANTGAESVVKIADGQYWLSLESWWWNAYAPIQDGDQLIIEGEFANSANGYTLNIDKTYITFISKANDNVVFSAAVNTEFGDVLLPNSGDTLNIGMWNGSYHVFEDKQLKELQAAGITKIMGINTLYIGNDTDGDGVISDAEVTSWLDRVYSYGISVIIDLRGWDGTTVPGYVNHPGLIGFLMYDEPCATEFDNLADLKAKFDAVMPADKLFYVNLFPSCAAGTSLVGSTDWMLGRRDYNTYYVQKFLDKIGAEVLSWDNYSLLDGNGIRTDYFYNFEVMAGKDVPLWYTMLSSGHGTTSASYATPTEAELRWQMAVALTYGVQNIDHYTYVSHESDYSCMVEYDTWEPTDLYYDILKVDNEYLAWDNIFMAYDWVGVGAVSANSNDAMLTKLNNSLDYTQYGLAAVSANENLLVGVFDYNGENAYMVTNAGSAGSTTVGDGKNFTMGDASVTLTLDDADYKCVAIIDNGEISYVAVNADNTVTLTVEAYEGVFVIPVLN